MIWKPGARQFYSRWFGIGYWDCQTRHWSLRKSFHIRIGGILFNVQWGGFDPW